jgi:hypothetical protein
MSAGKARHDGTNITDSFGESMSEAAAALHLSCFAYLSIPRQQAASRVRRQAHHTVLDLRSAEGPILEPLGEQAQARSIPEHQLDPIVPPRRSDVSDTVATMHLCFEVDDLSEVNKRGRYGQASGRQSCAVYEATIQIAQVGTLKRSAALLLMYARGTAIAAVPL